MIFMSPSASANVALPEPPPKDVLHQALSGSQEAADRFVAASGLVVADGSNLYWATIAAENGTPLGAFQIVSVLGDKKYADLVGQPYGDFRLDRQWFWWNKLPASWQGKAEAKPLSTAIRGSIYRLPTESEVRNWRVNDATQLQFRRAAMRGSGEAAFRLYEHYKALGALRQECLFWATIAAQNGHKSAFRVVGEFMLLGDQNDRQRAPFWLKKAADSGDTTAAESLRTSLPSKQ